MLDEEERTGLKVLCSLAHDDEKIPWDCEDCEHPDRKGGKQLSEPERQKESNRLKCHRGCIGKSAQPYTLFDGTKYWTCPRKIQRSSLGQYMRLYLWYDHKGTLPVGGGVLDQPSKVADAYELIRWAFNRIQRILNEEQERRAKRDRMRSKSKGR